MTPQELDQKQGRRLMAAFQAAAQAEGLAISNGSAFEIGPGVAQVTFVMVGVFQRRPEDTDPAGPGA